MRSKISTILIGVIIGIVLTASLFTFMKSDTKNDSNTSSDEKKPLYWVAPMDSNYRRDKPGKSPMGMDLIPVYENDDSQDSSPGVIKISHNVEHNLGVKTQRVEESYLNNKISTVGYISFNEEQLSHVNPRIEGWVEKLYIKATGEFVEKGQPLYEIYSPALVNAQEELLLAINRNNSTLINASKERLRSLYVPEQSINAILKKGKIQQTIVFPAPQSGYVDKLLIRQGMFVKPGTTIMSIGNLDEVWVDVEIYERQASLVNEKDKVTMTTEFLPGVQWEGEVDFIYPTLDTKTRTIKARIRIKNEDLELKPNMFTHITIHSSDSKKRLLVPSQAVIRTGDIDRVVISLGEGKFKSVKVKIGKITNSFIEILSGVKSGESVVVSAQFLIDSESSKTSDFKRIDHESEASAVWVDATVINVMENHNMITVDHEEVPEWKWPSMKMDFMVSDGISIKEIPLETQLSLMIERREDNNYFIVDFKEIDNKATVSGVINSLMPGHRMINISREGIEKWNRPAATLDFFYLEELDVSDLVEGDEIEFTFMLDDGEFLITEIHKTKSNN